MFDLMPFPRGDRSLSRYLDHFDKEFFGMFEGFKTDIEDQGDHFLLEAELPGFRREDIQVDLSDNRLTISARHSDEQEKKDKNYVRRERSYGSYQRSFDISAIQADAITAEYHDGVLALKLPKRDELKPVARKLEIQ